VIESRVDDTHRRVIVVGDIHGMDEQMHALLKKLSYDPKSDVLIHLGDIVTKGGHDGSMSVLSFMTTNNITSVRGNHDQKVVEWRSWLNWVWSRSGGRLWLNDMHNNWLGAQSHGMSYDDWVNYELYVEVGDWWEKVPKGWKLFGEHFNIAHDMTHAEYEYLLSLPLSLYVPSAHTFMAHAGLLSSDPRRGATHPRQPLSHVPILPSVLQHDGTNPNDTITALRRLQEMSILKDVPQNTDPWVVLNMRSILKDDNVSRRNKGTPWSELWNADMNRCAGFHYSREVNGQAPKPIKLPCLPATVLFGHAAKRGLDVKRWSMGLDSGCAHGKRLTALVLGPQSHVPSLNQADDVHTDSVIPYGDEGNARIVSVKC